MRRTILIATGLALLGGCASNANRAYAPQLAHARSNGTPLLVYALGVPGQIQTRGVRTAVPVYIQFVVTADTPLERVTFTLAAYNTRGYPVRGHDGRHVRMLLIGPGPFRPDGNYEVNSFHSRPAGFPGGEVACVELVGINVTYAGGKRGSYRQGSDALRDAIMAPLRGGCGDRGPVVSRMLGGGG